MTNMWFGLHRNHNPNLCPIKRIEKNVVLCRQMSIDLTTVCIFRPTTSQRGCKFPLLPLLPLRLADIIPNNIYSLRLVSTTVFSRRNAKKIALRGYFLLNRVFFTKCAQNLAARPSTKIFFAAFLVLNFL